MYKEVKRIVKHSLNMLQLETLETLRIKPFHFFLKSYQE